MSRAPLLAGETATATPMRLLVVYVPGGVNKDEWTPIGEGLDWKPRKVLEPLEKVREDVLILSGLDSRKGETGDNGHPLGCAPFLSTAPINERDRGGFCTDVSVDQMAAKELGKGTRLPSLEQGPPSCARPLEPADRGGPGEAEKDH